MKVIFEFEFDTPPGHVELAETLGRQALLLNPDGEVAKHSKDAPPAPLSTDASVRRAVLNPPKPEGESVDDLLQDEDAEPAAEEGGDPELDELLSDLALDEDVAEELDADEPSGKQPRIHKGGRPKGSKNSKKAPPKSPRGRAEQAREDEELEIEPDGDGMEGLELDSDLPPPPPPPSAAKPAPANGKTLKVAAKPAAPAPAPAPAAAPAPAHKVGPTRNDVMAAFKVFVERHGGQPNGVAEAHKVLKKLGAPSLLKLDPAKFAEAIELVR